MHYLLSALLTISLPLSWAVNSVVSDIIVGWPVDVRFAEMAPWLTNIELYAVNVSQKISLKLSGDQTTDVTATISPENGAGYIVAHQDGTFKHGVQPIEAQLSNGAHVALFASNDVTDYSTLVSSIAQLLGPENFCPNLERLLNMRKNAKKGFFCGKIVSLQNARNNHTSYTISGLVTPKKKISGETARD